CTPQIGPAACTLTIAPTSATVGNGASGGLFFVTTGATCEWKAVSTVGWITTASRGMGSGVVVYLVAENSGGTPRTGAIIVQDKVFTITQQTIEGGLGSDLGGGALGA